MSQPFPKYYLVRPEGNNVPLIPVDELPTWIQVGPWDWNDCVLFRNMLPATTGCIPREGEFDVICLHCLSGVDSMHRSVSQTNSETKNSSIVLSAGKGSTSFTTFSYLPGKDIVSPLLWSTARSLPVLKQPPFHASLRNPFVGIGFPSFFRVPFGIFDRPSQDRVLQRCPRGREDQVCFQGNVTVKVTEPMPSLPGAIFDQEKASGAADHVLRAFEFIGDAGNQGNRPDGMNYDKLVQSQGSVIKYVHDQALVHRAGTGRTMKAKLRLKIAPEIGDQENPGDRGDQDLGDQPDNSANHGNPSDQGDPWGNTGSDGSEWEDVSSNGAQRNRSNPHGRRGSRGHRGGSNARGTANPPSSHHQRRPAHGNHLLFDPLQWWGDQEQKSKRRKIERETRPVSTPNESQAVVDPGPSNQSDSYLQLTEKPHFPSIPNSLGEGESVRRGNSSSTGPSNSITPLPSPNKAHDGDQTSSSSIPHPAEGKDREALGDTNNQVSSSSTVAMPIWPFYRELEEGKPTFSLSSDALYKTEKEPSEGAEISGSLRSTWPLRPICEGLNSFEQSFVSFQSDRVDEKGRRPVRQWLDSAETIETIELPTDMDSVERMELSTPILLPSGTRVESIRRNLLPRTPTNSTTRLVGSYAGALSRTPTDYTTRPLLRSYREAPSRTLTDFAPRKRSMADDEIMTKRRDSHVKLLQSLAYIKESLEVLDYPRREGEALQGLRELIEKKLDILQKTAAEWLASSAEVEDMLRELDEKLGRAGYKALEEEEGTCTAPPNKELQDLLDALEADIKEPGEYPLGAPERVGNGGNG